jgi:predicted MFS family arabinose efflux permease
MLAQAISGIAKDLNKMSAKASVKLLIPKDSEQSSSKLFKWVAVLTGSKNTLKGLGFFLGGLLLSVFGFQGALWVLAGSLSLILFSTWLLLPKDMGKTKQKAKFSQLFSNSPEINWLAAARFFLFGSRDVWFVVALPVYLSSTLLWQHEQTGAFFALWIIAYGFVQAFAPKILNKHHPKATTTQWLAWCLMFVPAGIAFGLYLQWDATWLLIVGLAIYAIIFAINSAVHSYLIVEWSDADKVSMNVGFYYMANAGGRLVGTVLSGLVFQLAGLQACLILSALLVAAAAGLSHQLAKSA